MHTGATGALITRFAIFAFALNGRVQQPRSLASDRSDASSRAGHIAACGQIATALLIVLLRVSGLAGAQNPLMNLDIWFYPGFFYLGAIAGGIYSLPAPFALVLRITARLFRVF